MHRVLLEAAGSLLGSADSSGWLPTARRHRVCAQAVSDGRGAHLTLWGDSRAGLCQAPSTSVCEEDVLSMLYSTLLEMPGFQQKVVRCANRKVSQTEEPDDRCCPWGSARQLTDSGSQVPSLLPVAQGSHVQNWQESGLHAASPGPCRQTGTTQVCLATAPRSQC